MQLSSHFIPAMAYVKGVERLNSPVATEVHAQIQTLIGQAKESALQDHIALALFEKALFPVVAWIDERLALLPAWRQSREWRGLMLQRKFFSTSHAGVTFFERLQALEADEHALREVYVMCLGLGFVGRYSQEPHSMELARLREEHYRQLLSVDVLDKADAYLPLFPEAYRVVSGRSDQRKRSVRTWVAWALVVGVPLAVLGAVVFWSNQNLNTQVMKITKGLLW